MSNSNTNNPMSEYLLKLQLIVRNSEFKNKFEADKYETLESKLDGDKYVRAVAHTDIYESYKHDDKHIYQVLLENGIKEEDIGKYIQNPILIPRDIRQLLLSESRDNFIRKYKEPNKYYLNLTGYPFEGDKNTPADEVLTIPDSFYMKYRYTGEVLKDMPVHELPYRYQVLFMHTDEYQKMLDEHPRVDYIRHIGDASIPIEISRTARDGDIMRIDENRLSTFHPKFGNVTAEPSVVHAFSRIYRSTRDYVYQTLRGDFNNIITNYNELMRYLTIYMSMGACINEFQKDSTKLIYMNSVTANNLFDLYGLPSVIMEGSPMIEFLKKLRLLLMDKGTNIVYRVKDLIGYEDTTIYTLVMVKQQVFVDGYPIYEYNKETGEMVPKCRIVFRRLGTTGENVSYFKFRESKKEYDWKEIASGDPRWWMTEETERMLYDTNYTLSNSKYIQLSTNMSMTDIWWQCVIFLRGLLDKRDETQTVKISINKDINGETSMTLFDAVVTLIILMEWHVKAFNGATQKGELYYPTMGTLCLDLLFNGMDGHNPNPLKLGRPFKVASFNFDLNMHDNSEDYNYIASLDYMEPEKFINMIRLALDNNNGNVASNLMTYVRNVYDYIKLKLRDARTIYECRQAEDAYSYLFLVDPTRRWSDENNFDPDIVICERYKVTEFQYDQFKNFFIIDEEEPTPEVVFDYNDKTYQFYLYDILNINLYDYTDDDNVTVFRDSAFVTAFDKAIMNLPQKYDAMVKTSPLADNIRDNYKSIILDKVNMDASGGDSMQGPTTFETLLMMENSDLYDYISDFKKSDNDTEMISIIRVLIDAIDTYADANLNALKCFALGEDTYFSILKEVISYFKSYMVEFTKDDFKLIFGNILDNGGHADMLTLYDDIPGGRFEIVPKTSLSIFDVSHASCIGMMKDDNSKFIYDDVIFRLKTEFVNIKNKGYQLWYDDGKRITRTPYDIADDTEVTANFVKSDNTYKVIINVCNIDVIPPNYIGTVR